MRIAAVHLALNALRGRRRRDLRHLRVPISAVASGPEEAAVENDEGDEVRRALARLPSHSATVLVMRHSGLSYAEIAEAMNVKVGHVGTMLARAEVALRKEIDHEPRS